MTVSLLIHHIISCLYFVILFILASHRNSCKPKTRDVINLFAGAVINKMRMLLQIRNILFRILYCIVCTHGIFTYFMLVMCRVVITDCIMSLLSQGHDLFNPILTIFIAYLVKITYLSVDSNTLLENLNNPIAVRNLMT